MEQANRLNREQQRIRELEVEVRTLRKQLGEKDEIRHFKNLGYIRVTSHESKDSPGTQYMNPTTWVITPSGEDALAEYKYLRNKDAYLLKSIEELARIADAAVEQANIAEKKAESAEKDAIFPKATSIISLIVGTGGLVVAIISLALR